MGKRNLFITSVFGGSAGLVIFNIIGRVGIAACGTALSIGAAPMVVTGIVLSIAGYGLVKSFKRS